MGPDISNFLMQGKASVLYDGQFGSTGKGLAGAWVGEHNVVDWCTTNASANAGHTSIIDGKPVVLFHIPSSFLTAREHGYCRIYLNKGAIVDPVVLAEEVKMLGIEPHQLYVDPNAAVILPEDTLAEKMAASSATKIGSTQKGVGAALARKVMRQGPNLGMYLNSLTSAERKAMFGSSSYPFMLKSVSLNHELNSGMSVMIEVPQGFSLSLNASGFYPHTTSRDCTMQQGIADAGVHPRFFYKSMAVLRTYPIRVGNIKSEAGHQIGFSGRGYPDQQETSWAELGLEPEVTTVTKRVRRVFSFSKAQYQQMAEYSRPDLVFLNFCNYTPRTKLNRILSDIDEVNRRVGINPLHYYGYGPASADITEYPK